LRILTLVLAFVFLFTVTGRWVAMFVGPSMHFIRESWTLSDDPMVQELRQSVVRVYVDRPGAAPQGSVRGSGFNLSPDGLVVTNRHLVEDAAGVRVSFPGRGTYSAREWHKSPNVDLAVIDIEADELPSVKITKDPAGLGEDLLVIGNPLQFARIANIGTLVDYRENPGRDIPFLVVEAMIYPGSSGSPLFDGQGEVVGIIFATLRNREPSEVKGLAVDARELQLFLENLSYPD